MVMIHHNFLVDRRLALVCDWKTIWLKKQGTLSLNFFFYNFGQDAPEKERRKSQQILSISHCQALCLNTIISLNSHYNPLSWHCYPSTLKMRKLRLQDVKWLPQIPQLKSSSTGMRVQFWLQSPHILPPPSSTALSWTPSFLTYKIKGLSQRISDAPHSSYWMAFMV